MGGSQNVVGVQKRELRGNINTDRARGSAWFIHKTELDREVR